MITYKNVYNSNSDIKLVHVYLDRQHIGNIEKVDELTKKGWRYIANSRKHKGEVMSSIREVMRSLEES